uniref:Complex 1 LYR protein domain-containing protein n=1 Tax=Equus caballus TaxID=9796 RepID=A0A9L0SWW7_HORSE
MAASSRAQVLDLYRAMLRESKHFSAYNYRTLTGLGTPSVTGTYQEKIQLLKESQKFERQPRAKARLNNKFHLLRKATPSRLGEIPVSLIHRNKPTGSSKMRRQRNMFQTKEQDKNPRRKTLMKWRTYAVRRIRDAFRENKNVKDPVEIQALVNKAKRDLEIIRRQVHIGQLYSTDKLIIETQEKPRT